jgi:hypothetical protein
VAQVAVEYGRPEVTTQVYVEGIGAEGGEAIAVNHTRLAVTPVDLTAATSVIAVRVNTRGLEAGAMRVYLLKVRAFRASGRQDVREEFEEVTVSIEVHVGDRRS